ncbi:MAG: YvcK family protein [Nitrospirota bacterium]
MNVTRTIDDIHFLPARMNTKFAGLRVVALGGGTGLPVVLRSLKDILFSSSQYIYEHDKDRLTAIVTVTDDGGSSGRLRKEFNILPPGDIRNCLSALSENSALSSDLFQYRFGKGDGLNGHSLGNLLLAALTDLKGNFLEAIRCCGKIMDVRGQVLPFTTMNVSLAARFSDGYFIKGESSIAKHKGSIYRVFLHPSFPDPLPQAIDAIEKADVIIIGPGSLYTSIIPNLLVKGIALAIERSRAKKIYICNLMTEPGETDDYTVSDHVKAIFDHSEHGLFQYVVINKGKISADLQENYIKQDYYPVTYTLEEIKDLGLTSIVADVISEQDQKIRHDPDKLGRLFREIL